MAPRAQQLSRMQYSKLQPEKMITIVAMHVRSHVYLHAGCGIQMLCVDYT